MYLTVSVWKAVKWSPLRLCASAGEKGLTGQFPVVMLRGGDPSWWLLPMESQESFDPPSVGFVRPRAVAFREASLMGLVEQLHVCMISCANTDVDMRTWKEG